MEAALAEMSIDDLMQDVEEDVDFISKGVFFIFLGPTHLFIIYLLLADEEDMFESDFASTDEEAGEDEAGEKALEEEEKRAKKVCRWVASGS